jgi:hypothetical protein
MSGDYTMTNIFGRMALVPNPALQPLSWLVGVWDTTGRHPMLTGIVLHGRTSCEWSEGGAFLTMRSAIDEPGVPDGIAIIGSDDAAGRLFMSYFDERRVSRLYEIAVHDKVMRWWRDAPGFSQRYTYTLADDGQTIHGTGQLCKDGSTWEQDLELVFSRAR